MIAALFVMTNGPYYGLPNVDPWDEQRDARKYDGPYPVVAHPPCERWGRYAEGSPRYRSNPKYKIGDDNGCFESAIRNVRKFGGVIEHPRWSHAYEYFGINKPNSKGGWIVADTFGGYSCQVEQAHYGHLARKPTWLYFVGKNPPELKWGPSIAHGKIDCGVPREWREAYRMVKPPKEERRRDFRGVLECACCGGFHLTKKERKETPIPFRDLLISMAESVTTASL